MESVGARLHRHIGLGLVARTQWSEGLRHGRIGPLDPPLIIWTRPRTTRMLMFAFICIILALLSPPHLRLA